MLFFAAGTIAAIHYADHLSAFFGAFSRPIGVRAAVTFSIAFAVLVLVRRSLWLAPAAALMLCAANGFAVYDPSPIQRPIARFTEILTN